MEKQFNTKWLHNYLNSFKSTLFEIFPKGATQEEACALKNVDFSL